MNTTEHYQLNQWEGSDRIMREDFNADNRKTEEALTELADTVAQKVGQAEVDAALQWVKIGESVLSGSAKSVSVTVENVEQYRCLLLLYDVSGGTEVSIRWSGSSAITLSNAGWDNLKRSFGVLTAYLLHQGGVYLSGNATYLSASAYNVSSRLSAATTTGTATVEILAKDANNTSSDAMSSGSALCVYGLRT